MSFFLSIWIIVTLIIAVCYYIEFIRVVYTKFHYGIPRKYIDNPIILLETATYTTYFAWILIIVLLFLT